MQACCKRGLNFLNGLVLGSIIAVSKGDTRSLDYSSYDSCVVVILGGA